MCGRPGNKKRHVWPEDEGCIDFKMRFFIRDSVMRDNGFEILLFHVGSNFEFTAERVRNDRVHRQIKANTFSC